MMARNPMAAMANFYADAFQQSARLWLQQTRAWRAAFPQTLSWPVATVGAGIPVAPAPMGLGALWFEPVSLELVEMEDRIGVSASCGEIRIDMMITHSPEAGAGSGVIIEGEAEPDGSSSGQYLLKGLFS